MIEVFGTDAELARAKVNLYLHVTGRRRDGYHTLESLVGFADVGDVVRFDPDEPLGLELAGPYAEDIGADEDNLVLRAVRELDARVDGLRLGRFALEKNLPVASGLGGGSADAAAALRALARHNGLELYQEAVQGAARATGADVLVCLFDHPAVMRGIGDILAPRDLPALPAILVNPAIPVSTADIFGALARPADDRCIDGDSPDIPSEREALIRFLGMCRNDLESAALKICPEIETVLKVLARSKGARLARMSGSGASCFALFAEMRSAQSAADEIAAQRPDWWVRATRIGA